MQTVRTGRRLFMVMLLVVTATAVCEAQQDPNKSTSAVHKETPRNEGRPKVTIEKAIQAALEHAPGRVHELEVVHKKGTLIWEVDVITNEGEHVLVDVNGTTGAVIRAEKKSIERFAGDPIKGKEVFEKHCLSCHGADGRGTGPMGPLLIPPAADYTAEASRTKSDAELLHAIQEGRPGTAMRSFKRWLSKQEMRDVLSYVRVLSRQSTH